MKNTLLIILIFSVLTPTYASEQKLKSYYVTTELLNIRLSPSKNGKITSSLFEKNKVNVLEFINGWARISKYYSGNVEGVNGQVARWVFAKYLTTSKPKVSIGNSPLEKALKSSDNYSIYKNTFISASKKLINSGKCSISDFNQMGGWMRSSTYKPKAIFFTYCGGMTLKNKVYLNANNGNTFR